MPNRNFFFIFSPLLLLFGCVTNIQPSKEMNPPPLEPLTAFSAFELAPLDAAATVKNSGDANQRALVEIEKNLRSSFQTVTSKWHSDPSVKRTLLVQPKVTELKFVSGGKRALAGAWSGSSAVVMNVTLREKETGKVIAEPEFFQRAAAMGGAWSFGGTDNHMLSRIAQLVVDYMEANYARAVGGPTSG